VIRLDRRRFVQGLAASALLAPAMAHAQSARIPRVAYVSAGDLRNPNTESFEQGLKDAGYVPGQSVVIEYRGAEGKMERLPSLVDEIVKLKADVIFAAGPPAIVAVLKATRTLPVIGIDLESDPVASGFVQSLARPGGNFSGLFLDAPELAGKLLQLIQEAVPRLRRVAVLWHTPVAQVLFRASEEAARTARLTLLSLPIGAPEELDDAVARAARERTRGLVVLSSPLFFFNRARIADLALKHRLPAISLFTQQPEVGLLMAYGPYFADMFRRCGAYVARVLGGAKPADLPVERPSRFEMVINLKTAKALGLTLPQLLRARADRLIE
jgi:putative ABC transport system substrate-binding protein